MSREMVKRKGQSRREETVTPTTSGYNLRPRSRKRVESRPTIERNTQQGGPFRSRKGRGRNDSLYIEERTRSNNSNARQGGDRQRQDQERKGVVRESLYPWRSCDEAHFWLNGYVNKQDCRIWSEANPQVYVETPLHPEKLTVWCALWAGGILLQKR
ncbi:uncharacterized protein TNCV_3882611 [Trichonephila clavipes]|nr:uncharacterized protein TNCV_3882611 [Trichonephila clavipes]